MSATINNLKDKNGNTIYPVTKTNAVLDSNNVDVDTKITNLQNQINTLNKSWLFTGALRTSSEAYVNDCILDFELPYTGTYNFTLIFNKHNSNGNGGIEIGIFNNYSDLTNGNYSGWFVSPANGWKINFIYENRHQTDSITFSANAGEHLLIFAGNGNQVSTTKSFTLKLSI